MKDSIKAMLHIAFYKATKPLRGKGLSRLPFVASIYKILEARITPKENQKIIDLGEFSLLTSLNNLQELIYEGEYEPYTTAIFKALVKPGMTIIDIGANNGYYTVLANTLMDNKGIVWAFEPDPRSYSDLLYNIELNSLKNIRTACKAISNKNGKSIMYTSPYKTGESSLFKGYYQTNKIEIEVETVKLDDILEGEPDIIKIDTEGSELAVLEGAERLLTRCKKTKIIMEIASDKSLKAAGSSTEKIWGKLHQYNYKYNYMLNGKSQTEPTTVDELRRFCTQHGGVNILCLKTKRDIC